MVKVERFGLILARLSAGDPVTVEQLAGELEVSDATIRRDLAELESQGVLTRTHGGAVSGHLSGELPVRYRGQRSEEKWRVGSAAAALVPDGAVVGISGGSTTTAAARALANRSGLTIVTNALNIAAELALRPALRLIVTGGLARSASFELVGPIAEQTIANYNLDILLLGVDGIEAKLGCTTHDLIEAGTNAAMVRRARKVVVLADSTKIGRVALAEICGVSDVDCLVTDSEDSIDAELGNLKAAGVQIQRV